MANSQKITAELKEHIGKNHGELIQGIYQNFDAWDDARIIPNVKNNIRLTSLQIGSILKPYTNTFSATPNAIEFKARTMTIHTGKAELTVDPEEYRTTYLAQWMKPGMSRTPDELPFAKYIMEEIIKSIQQDLNNVTSYHGEHDPAGTGPIDVTDGWGTMLAKMITDGEVVPEVLGAINATNAYTKLKQLYRSIPEVYRRKDLNLTAYLSRSTYEALEDQLDTLNINTGRGDDPLAPKYLRGTDGILKIKPASWMAGSSRVFITPETNLCILSDNTNEDINNINVLQSHYTADLTVTLAIGFDFATNMLWCNEEA